VQRRIAEHRVEFLGEAAQPCAVGHMRIEAPHPRGGHLLDAGVDAGDTRLPCQNRRERALAAAEIENPLVRTRREQLDHRLAQHRDEPALRW